jgi:O-antigen/teichoic acid export membrane protein
LISQSRGLGDVYKRQITFSKPIALTSIALSIFKILILAMGFNEKIIDFKFLCVVWILEVLISSVICSYLYFEEINKLEVVQKVKLKSILKLWREGFMFWMPLVLMTFFWRIDRILVKNIVTEHDAGIYLAGMQLFDAVVSIALIISVSLAPSLIYQYSDEIKIKVNSFKLIFFMTAMGIICAFIGYFVSPYIVPRLFGAAFIEAVPIVQTAFCLSLLVFVDAALTVNLIKRLGAYYAFKKWISIIFIAVPIEYFAVTLWGGQAAHLGIAAGYCFALIFGFYQLNIS